MNTCTRTACATVSDFAPSGARLCGARTKIADAHGASDDLAACESHGKRDAEADDGILQDVQQAERQLRVDAGGGNSLQALVIHLGDVVL